MDQLSQNLSAEYDGALWHARRDGVSIGRFAFAHQALAALSSPTPMTTDLQARLREIGDGTKRYRPHVEIRNAVNEAADRLDALSARIQELEGALRGAADTFEKIREILINHLNEPERSAFWAAVGARDAARSALGRNAG